MFNPTEVVIDGFVDLLQATYLDTYGRLEPDYPNMLGYLGRLSLEIIANSDAPYHNTDHTIKVTLVGQEILRGKHLSEGGIWPTDWLHFMVSLLCHDIGYVRGICRGDGGGRYVIDGAGQTIALPVGATDASLTLHHIARGQIFVRERFADNPLLDAEILAANIAHTRFPRPSAQDHPVNDDYPGLIRAADVIGFLADPSLGRKGAALYSEFRETGLAEKLELASSADVLLRYPAFYWDTASPFISDVLRYLRITEEGTQWIANLYAGVFAEEHQTPALGPERRG